MFLHHLNELVLPCISFFSLFAILPIEVVFPTPFTPTTSITEGFVSNLRELSTSSNIDSTTFAIEDVNDVRKIDEFTVYIEGKRSNNIEKIDLLTSSNGLERSIKTNDVISVVKKFSDNKIKFINNDELIVQDKNINVVLGYLTGELEQTECKTNGYYIKVFNHNTNRFIGEYEIIDGIF